MVFDVDYNELTLDDRATFIALAKIQFCARITANGKSCDVSTLEVVLSAGSRRRARQTGSTVATVTLPAGTTAAQATSITSDINTNSITLQNGDDSTTSTGASMTAEEDPNGNSAASAQAFPVLVTVAAAAAIAVLML